MILGLFSLFLILESCDDNQQPQTEEPAFNWKTIAEQIDRIDTSSVDMDALIVPSATIVDPETFTELTTISSDGSNLGLISRRSGIWRFVKGDTLKSWIESFASSGTTYTAANGVVIRNDSILLGTNTLFENTTLDIDTDGNQFTLKGGSEKFLEAIRNVSSSSSTLYVGLLSANINFTRNSDYSDMLLSTGKFSSSDLAKIEMDTLIRMYYDNSNFTTWPDNSPTACDVIMVDAQTDSLVFAPSPLDSVQINFFAASGGGQMQSTGDINVGFWRVPAHLDGYTVQDISYESYAAGSGTGTHSVSLEVNGSGVWGCTYNTGDSRCSTSDATFTVSEGDLMNATVTASTMTTRPSGLVINLLLTKN